MILKVLRTNRRHLRMSRDREEARSMDWAQKRIPAARSAGVEVNRGPQGGFETLTVLLTDRQRLAGQTHGWRARAAKHCRVWSQASGWWWWVWKSKALIIWLSVVTGEQRPFLSCDLKRSFPSLNTHSRKCSHLGTFQFCLAKTYATCIKILFGFDLRSSNYWVNDLMYCCPFCITSRFPTDSLYLLAWSRGFRKYFWSEESN